MTIKEVQDEIIDEFEVFDDWMDKYQLLIDTGNELTSLDEQYKKPQYLIEGCQSRVWLHADFDGERMMLQAESDAVIVKGIIALLVRVLSNRTPSEILNAELYFIDRIGLKDHLSPTRSNGLVSMIRQIRNYALAFSLKNA
jgi:cysteine desulfuration protein SufE